MSESVLERDSPAYQLVDIFPEVAEARAHERLGALALLERRRGGEDMGSGIAELIPVDALSTAYHVIAAEETHGPESAERAERWEGLVQDCRRLVAEWYRKKKPEYFKPLRHTFDAASETFFSHGLSVRQMTENALVPMPEYPEEEGRRVNERVEDATPQIMRRLGRMAAGQTLRTISECTDWALDAYTEDLESGGEHRGYGGYVPEIAKLMVRDIMFQANTDDRFEEQIGLPGIYFTHEILQEALRRRELEVGYMDKSELHGAQILANDDLMEFVRLLDEVASEQWCTNIFMGEEVSGDFMKDYEGFREEALRRQAGLEDLALTTAVFILDLAQDGADRRTALPMVEEFVKLLLVDLAKRKIATDEEGLVLTEQIFDAKTAEGLQRVVQLEAAERYEEAFSLEQQVEKNAPGGGFCGAGSCGLEGVNLHTDSGRDLVGRLGVKAGDMVVRDKVRACKNKDCKKKTVIYVYNSKKVSKYCESCGAYE